VADKKKYACKPKKDTQISRFNHNTFPFSNKIIYLNILNKLTPVKNERLAKTGMSYFHLQKKVLNLFYFKKLKKS